MAELFCGIGGAAAALAGSAADVVAAADLNHRALAVYSHNFTHNLVLGTLESLPAARMAAWEADLWWASPPCQPFTRRGLGRDDDDARSRPLLTLIDRLRELQPRYFALENVPGFAGSRTHGRLRAGLVATGYTIFETELCPSELGQPNRRRRFYLVAARGTLESYCPATKAQPALATFLDRAPAAELWVGDELIRRYGRALHVVRADDPAAVTACFTSAYGRSPVRSGSYLETSQGLRRFSPAEILRLLGFPRDYGLPPDTPCELGWRLVGNSLSLPAVRQVLTTIPELATLRANAC